MVTSPLNLRYGQVHNSFMPIVPFPPEIVQRFKGRVMAITGYENQQSRIDNKTGEEFSVPCSDLYNHHWNLYLNGAAAGEMSPAELQLEKERHSFNGGRAPKPDFGPRAGSPPIRQVLSEGNGNEHRGSFHGVPKGYAQLLHSPQSGQFLHMSINTRNPDGHNLDPQKGLQPRSSTSAMPGAGDHWSGVLECPCTTRVTREINGHVLQNHGACSQRSSSASTKERRRT